MASGSKEDDKEMIMAAHATWEVMMERTCSEDGKKAAVMEA